jgi:hypothetical protein
LDNALISLHNSGLNLSRAASLKKPDEEVEQVAKPFSIKDNIMQHLTNLRFRFNDGDFFK